MNTAGKVTWIINMVKSKQMPKFVLDHCNLHRASTWRRFCELPTAREIVPDTYKRFGFS